MQIPQLSNFINKAIYKLAQVKRVNNDSASSLADAELNDLSYKDALLDAQARSFFRAEYGDIEPPPTVFPRLAHAIRLHSQEQERQARAKVTSSPAVVVPARRLGLAMVGLYRASSSAGTSRVLSGGLVTVLLMLAMGPNLAQVLGGPTGVGNFQGGRVDSGVITSVSPTEPQHTRSAAGQRQIRLLLEQKTGEDFDAPYQIQEGPPLDPAELRLVQKKISKQYIEPAHKLNAKGPE